MITHNPVVAARAQRQIRIRDGRLSEQGPALREDPELLDDPGLLDNPWVKEDPRPQEDPGARYGERNGGAHALPGG